MSSPTRTIYKCSFCGRTQDQVKHLIAGPGGVFICDECVRLCMQIIDEEEQPARPRQSHELPTP